jgi:hypothetical protein
MIDIEQLRNFRAEEIPYPVVERALREKLIFLINEQAEADESIVGALVLHGSFGACRVVADNGDGNLTIIHGDCVFNVHESDVVSFGRLLRDGALRALRRIHDRRLDENERDALGYEALLDDLRMGCEHIRGVDCELTVAMQACSGCGEIGESKPTSADENVTEPDSIAIVAKLVEGSPVAVGC